MNRREFLQSLGILGLTAVTPKYIFDVGANLYKPTPEFEIINDEIFFRVMEYMPAYSLVIPEKGRLVTTSNAANIPLKLGVISQSYNRGDWGKAWSPTPSIKPIAVRVSINGRTGWD